MSKFFSKSFYIDTLYRLRGIIIFSLIFFTIMSSSTPVTMLLQLMELENVVGGMSQIPLRAYDFMTIVAFSVIVVPIMTITAFSFLYKRNTADFFEHLPYTRLSMSVSALLAVMTVAIGVITAASLVSSLLLIPSVSAGLVRYDFLSGIPFAIAALVTAFYTMSAAFVGVSVTGTVFGSVLTTLAIILYPRAAMSLTTLFLESLSPTLVSGHSIPIFNNSYNLATTLSIDKFAVLGTPTAYIYTLILGAALLAFGIYLYRKRRSEAATRRFASRMAFDVVRIATSALLVFLSIMLMFVELWIVGALIIGFLLLTHYLTGRRQGGVGRSLLTLAIGVGISVVIFVSTLIGSALVNSYSPDADEISYVSLSRDLDYGPNFINYSEYVDLRVSDIKIEGADVRALVATALDRGAPKNYFDYRAVPVKIKSGAIPRYRTLYLTNEEYSTLNESYLELPAYKDIWLAVDEGAYNPYIYINGQPIDDDKVAEIFEKYKSEISAMGFEEFYSLYFNEWSEYTLCYSVSHEGYEIIVNLPILEELTETYALTKRCAKEIEERIYNELISRLDEAINSDKIHFLSLDYYGDNDMYYAFIELGEHNSESADIVAKVKSYITPEMTFDKSATMFVSIYSDDFNDYGVSASFAVNADIGAEEIVSFFKKYGY